MKKEQVILQCWPRWLSKESAALYTDWSITKIERLIRSGELPYCRVKRSQIRIDLQDLDRLLLKNKIDPEKAKKMLIKSISNL